MRTTTRVAAWGAALVVAWAPASARATAERADALIEPERAAPAPSPARKWGSLGGVAGVYAGATTYMYFAWYHGQPDLPAFRVGGDGWFGARTYAGGVDKLGHAWASLALSRVSGEILDWGGWERWKAGVVASSLTLGLLTALEVKDGYYTEFSPGDSVFNALGAGLNVAMMAWPPLDELLDSRVEYLPSREYRALLRGERPPEDPAAPHQVSLNFVEDYSGQRYLVALHLGAIPGLRGRTWARLVDVAVGYEANRYEPEPLDGGGGRSQHLFAAVSVNLQGAIDLVLADRTDGASTGTRTVGHLMFELVNPPFGSAAVAGVTRSPDR